MSSIQITVTPSFEKVGDAFRAFAQGIALQKKVEKLGFQVEREAKRVTPVDTGRLRASINTTIGTLQAIVAPHTHYAIYVHEGTRYMRARPFLTWGAEAAGLKPGGGEGQFTATLAKDIEKEFESWF